MLIAFYLGVLIKFTNTVYHMLDKMFCRLLHFINSLQSANVLISQTLKKQINTNIIWQNYMTIPREMGPWLTMLLVKIMVQPRFNRGSSTAIKFL